MSGWRLLPFALLVISLGACAHAGLGQGRADGFVAVETRHFALYTDLAADRAGEQARRLEELLFALQETGWESTGDLPLKMNVIMFADQRDFVRFAGDDVAGFAVSEALFEPWMVLPAPRFGDDYGVVAHELTHVMSYQSIMNMPSWLSEGLATYFESAHFHVDGSFQVGAVPKRHQRWLQYGWDLPSDLLSGRARETDLRFYASSWLFVHFLMTQHADAFVAFQDQLARGLDARAAWQRAFPTLSGDALDEAVVDYARAGMYESALFELRSLEDVPLSTRPLSAADQHALFALLWTHGPDRPAEKRAQAAVELRAAIAAEPYNVWGATLDIMQDLALHPMELTRAQALVDAHPEHWLSWLVLGMSALRSGQLPELSRDPARDPGAQAVRLAPRQPYALALQALTAAARRETAFALTQAKAAQRLQPTNPRLMQLRGAVLEAVDASAELGELVGQVQDNAHATNVPQIRRELEQRLARCQAKIAAQSAPAP